MNCSDFNGLFSSYMDGDIQARDKEQLENHLKGCGDCKAELEILKKIDTMVETHLAETVVPRRFAARVLEQIRKTSQEKPEIYSRAKIFYFPAWKTALSAAIIIFVLMIPVYRSTLSAEAQLQTIQMQVDQFSGIEAENIWSESLAIQFGTSEALIESLREKGHGWGEILIVMTVAQSIFQDQAHHYESIDDALRAIEPARKQGKNWSRIGQDLQFQLGPVVRQARLHRDDFRMIAQELKEKKEVIKNEIKDIPVHAENDMIISEDLTLTKPEVQSFKDDARIIRDESKQKAKDVHKEAIEIKKEASDSKKDAHEMSHQAKESTREARENANEMKEQAKQDVKAARIDAQEAKKDSKQDIKAVREDLRGLHKENKENAK